MPLYHPTLEPSHEYPNEDFARIAHQCSTGSKVGEVFLGRYCIFCKVRITEAISEFSADPKPHKLDCPIGRLLEKWGFLKGHEENSDWKSTL